MFGTLIAIVVAAVVFWLCSALGLPYVVGVVAAVVLVTGIPGLPASEDAYQRAGTENRRPENSAADDRLVRRFSFSEAQ